MRNSTPLLLSFLMVIATLADCMGREIYIGESGISPNDLTEVGVCEQSLEF